MSKISTYPKDTNVTGQDLLVGSDWNTPGKITKNFSTNALASYFNKSAIIDTGQFSWEFLPYNNTQPQPEKTFMKVDWLDDTININNLAGVLRVSALTLGNTQPGAFIENEWVGNNILVHIPNAPSAYAIYTVDALVPDGDWYYLMTISYVGGQSFVIQKNEPVVMGYFAGANVITEITGTFPVIVSEGSIPDVSIDPTVKGEWDLAYDNSIVSAAVTGTSTKTLTLTQQDGGTITASWTDEDTNLVTSVFGRTGAVVAVSGDYNTSQVTESTNLYFTQARAIASPITGYSPTLGTITATDTILTAINKLAGSYVPYTGAINNVNLGEKGITAGYVGFDLTPTATPTGVGTMYWDPAYRTVALIDGDGDTTLQIGQEERILVHNNTGSTLTDGQVVYVTGSTGNLPSVSLADASSETTSAATLGVVTESIANGADGFITVSGIVNGLNTLAFTEGDLLWLSETAGQFTNVKPISPAHLVLIGYVIKKAGGNGSILVKIQNTQELSESSDVLISAPEIDGQGLFLQTISGVQLWRNRSIVDVLGYTPADEATLISTTAPLSGGGDLSTNRTLSISQSGASTDGYLSSVDWNTFNNKQGALTLTTTGSSGAATLIGNTLNIPNYGTALANYLPLTGGTLTGGLYINPTNTATVGLDVASNTVTFRSDNLEGFKRQLTTTMGSGTLVKMQAAGYGGTYVTDLGFYTSSSSAVNTTPNLYLTGGDNRVGINTVTPAYTLDVAGTAGVSGVLTLGSTISNGTYNYTLPSASGTLALTSDIPTGTISGSGTTNYVPKFTSASAIGNSNIQDSGTLITLGSNTTISSGSLGIGSASLTGYGLRNSKNITGALTSYAYQADGTIQSDVTGNAYMYRANVVTQAATFTLANLVYFSANQNTIGAGSTVTNQSGFRAESTLIGATNNYGFYGGIASQANTWNLYMAGTASNYLAGSLGIGTTGLSEFSLRVGKAITGAAFSYGIVSDGVVQSIVTSDAYGYRSNIGTQATTFTLGNLIHYGVNQGTIGAGSTVTNNTGFLVNSTLIGGTNNYGFRGNIPSGTNRWNLYMDGTASNYLAGDTTIGTTTLGTATKLTIGGSETAVSAIARGQLINPTLVASANSDVLVGLDIAPTFTNGAFTGVTNFTLRTNGAAQIGNQLQVFKNQLVGNVDLNLNNGASTWQGGMYYRTESVGTNRRLTLYSGGSAGVAVDALSIFLGGNVAINSTTDITSAALQVTSTTKGFLPPRMTAAQRAAIATPAEGLVVVQTDGTQGLYLYIGAAWHAMTML